MTKWIISSIIILLSVTTIYVYQTNVSNQKKIDFLEEKLTEYKIDYSSIEEIDLSKRRT